MPRLVLEVSLVTPYNFIFYRRKMNSLAGRRLYAAYRRNILKSMNHLFEMFKHQMKNSMQ